MINKFWTEVSDSLHNISTNPIPCRDDYETLLNAVVEFVYEKSRTILQKGGYNLTIQQALSLEEIKVALGLLQGGIVE